MKSQKKNLYTEILKQVCNRYANKINCATILDRLHTHTHPDRVRESGEERNAYNGASPISMIRSAFDRFTLFIGRNGHLMA